MDGQRRSAPWPTHPASPAAKMEFPPVVGGADTGDEEEAEQDPRAEATLQVGPEAPPPARPRAALTWQAWNVTHAACPPCNPAADHPGL
jgi:hypothetical protein